MLENKYLLLFESYLILKIINQIVFSVTDIVIFFFYLQQIYLNSGDFRTNERYYFMITYLL